jgi:hypothetical protein
MTHPHEDDLVLHYYGELLGPAAGTLEKHLQECAACRDSFTRLEQVLRAVDEGPAPEPSEDFERAVWARLRPGLRAIRPARASAFGLRHSAFLPRWALAGGIAALVVIAFLAGALWRQRSIEPGATGASNAPTPGPAPSGVNPSPGSGASADFRERLLLAVVGDHLERSELVLVELLNARGSGTVDIAAERTRAEELASENRLYRQTAQSVGNLPLVSLLDQLDLIFTEVAGGPATIPAADLDAIRRRIEGQNLLFKVQVVRSALGAQEREAAARRAHITS